MGEIRLFNITKNKAKEIESVPFNCEREIQRLFESNLEVLLGVQFVASEFPTSNSGRIDTLGIDENGFPVIIEYKLDKNRTVINQGMFYMAWLRSHSAEFWKLVFEKLGKEVADSIDNTSVRLICIASDFTREDLGAYELMPNNIDLIRYRRFGTSHLLLERITASDASVLTPEKETSTRSSRDKSFIQWLEEASPELRAVYETLRRAILSQGEDVSEKQTKLYTAFRRIRNFATVAYANRIELNLYLHLDPKQIELREGCVM
ncbi:MAG: DUF5655 domain-containing protein [Armatimonadota bacterium]|nr:DUF5655 domain-containing protein [Armatimonadota bacterium]